MRATRIRYSVDELRELADSNAVPVVLRQPITDALFHVIQAHERIAGEAPDQCPEAVTMAQVQATEREKAGAA